MTKNIRNRIDRDVRGSLTTMLILGIIVESKRVWTYQIKQRFKEIANRTEGIPTSSLYATLNKLEKDYGLIFSEMDEQVLRRFFHPTEKGTHEFQRLKNYWFEIMQNGVESLNLLKIDEKRR